MLNRVILPWLLFLFYSTLYRTWRIEVHKSDFVRQALEKNENFILAHWHGDELGILHLLKPLHVACIISTSKDGEIMNRVVQLLGAETARGSSTRGGTGAIKGMLRLFKQGRRPSVAVDGPKGPIYQVKPGVLQISRMAHLPIVPISFAASRSHVFEKAWNKTALPLPFSRVVIQLGQEMPALTKSEDPKDAKIQQTLKGLIDQTKQQALNRLNC